MRRITWGAVLLLGLSTLASAETRKINVTFSPGWGGCYRPEEWTPIDLTLVYQVIWGKKEKRKPVDPLSCGLQFTAAQDNSNNLIIRRDSVVLVPQQARFVPMVAKIGYTDDECELTLRDDDGRIWHRKSYGLVDMGGYRNAARALNQQDTLIGLVRSSRPGMNQGVFGLRKLEKNARSISQGRGGRVFVKEKQPHLCPSDWTGYASLDALVLYDVDVQKSFTRHQMRAIGQWVRNGGRLFVVVGSKGFSGESDLARSLGLKLSKEDIEIPVSDYILQRWGVTKPGKPKLTIRPPAVLPRGFTRQKLGFDRDVYYQAPVGFGKVGLLAFDPDSIKGTAPLSVEVARFWVSRLEQLLPPARQLHFEESGGVEQDYMDYYSLYLGEVSLGTNGVINHLHNIEELKPLSIWWVILLLGLLALLLGPVDYLVLRLFDRLPWTWVTSIVIVVLFSIGAFYGVRALRAGSGKVRVVTVVDAVQGAPAWRTTYAGIYASVHDTYEVVGTEKNEWWSGLAPTAYELSDPTMQQRAKENIYTVQTGDGGNLVTALPISLWTMKYMLCETPDGEMPLKVRLENRSQTGVDMEIHNTSDHPIASGYIRAEGNRIVHFGEIPPGKKVRVRDEYALTTDWNSALDGMDQMGGFGRPAFSGEEAFFARGTLRRTRAMEQMMRDGAVVVVARYDGAPTSFRLGSSSDYTHIKMVRLIVR